MHLRSAKQNKAGSDSSSDAARTDTDSDPNMAEGAIPTSPTIPEGVNIEDQPDRAILLQILENQRLADKKSEERFASLRKQIKESNKLLESYAKTNDAKITQVESTVTNTVSDLKALQDKVNALESKLDITINLLDSTQVKLEGAIKDINENAKLIGKHERKYKREEEEIKRCSLILDGVNERDNKKTRLVINSLLKDLNVEFKDVDIKAAYMLGPIRNGVARPRSIKVIFANISTKGEIFKKYRQTETERQLERCKTVGCDFTTGTESTKGLKMYFCGRKIPWLKCQIEGK